MASRSKKNAQTSTSTSSHHFSAVPPGERIYLSPDEIEHKSKAQVIDAYVEELGGWIRARLVGADRVIAFLKSSSEGDAGKLEAMAQLVSETLANEDGSDFLTKDQARRYPVSTLDNIIGAVAEARKAARGNV